MRPDVGINRIILWAKNAFASNECSMGSRVRKISKKRMRDLFIKYCSLLTSIAFFINILSYDIVLSSPFRPKGPAGEGQAWAAKVSPGFPHVGSGKKLGPGSHKILDVKKFMLPEHLGTVNEKFPASPAPKKPGQIAILIQDAHCNYAAQKKIAEIIEYFSDLYGVRALNLEGGKGRYDLSIFTDIRNRKLRKEVSGYFVMEGLVSGAEYFTINNPESVDLWGIEDAPLYLDNLKMYRDSLGYKDIAENIIRSINHALNSLKLRIYPKELLEFDLEYARHKAGNIEFKEYLKYLLDTASRKGIDISDLANIGLLNQSLEKEEKINFKKADDEKQILIGQLQKALSRGEIEELIMKTFEFEKERLSRAEFYEYLILKGKELRLQLEKYPELNKYVEYVSIYHAADKTKTVEEVNALEERIKTSLCQNKKQEELSKLSKDLAILKNLFNATLTYDDYNYYKKNEVAFRVQNYISFIKKESPRYKIAAKLPEDAPKLDLYRGDMEKFYEFSFKRDGAFIENMRFAAPAIKRPPRGIQMAAIITGGFHTENLCKLFKDKGIGCISIMPNFKDEEGYVSPYFSLLSGKPSSMEAKIRDALGFSIAIASFASELSEDVYSERQRLVFDLHVMWKERADQGGGIVLKYGDRTRVIDANGTVLASVPADKRDLFEEIDVGRHLREIRIAMAKPAAPPAAPLAAQLEKEAMEDPRLFELILTAPEFEEICREIGIDESKIEEYKLETMKFTLAIDNRLILGEEVTEEGDEFGKAKPNYGDRILTERLSELGINPDRVLLFRITDLRSPDDNKPEDWWATNLSWVIQQMLGTERARVNNVLLAATLSKIIQSAPEGLSTIQDDTISGGGVKRIGNYPMGNEDLLIQFEPGRVVDTEIFDEESSLRRFIKDEKRKLAARPPTAAPPAAPRVAQLEKEAIRKYAEYMAGRSESIDLEWAEQNMLSIYRAVRSAEGARHTTLYYPASGSDVLRPLLAYDAEHLIAVDDESVAIGIIKDDLDKMGVRYSLEVKGNVNVFYFEMGGKPRKITFIIDDARNVDPNEYAPEGIDVYHVYFPMEAVSTSFSAENLRLIPIGGFLSLNEHRMFYESSPERILNMLGLQEFEVVGRHPYSISSGGIRMQGTYEGDKRRFIYRKVKDFPEAGFDEVYSLLDEITKKIIRIKKGSLETSRADEEVVRFLAYAKEGMEGLKPKLLAAGASEADVNSLTGEMVRYITEQLTGMQEDLKKFRSLLAGEARKGDITLKTVGDVADKKKITEDRGILPIGYTKVYICEESPYLAAILSRRDSFGKDDAARFLDFILGFTSLDVETLISKNLPPAIPAAAPVVAPVEGAPAAWERQLADIREDAIRQIMGLDNLTAAVKERNDTASEAKIKSGELASEIYELEVARELEEEPLLPEEEMEIPEKIEEQLRSEHMSMQYENSKFLLLRMLPGNIRKRKEILGRIRSLEDKRSRLEVKQREYDREHKNLVDEKKKYDDRIKEAEAEAGRLQKEYLDQVNRAMNDMRGKYVRLRKTIAADKNLQERGRPNKAYEKILDFIFLDQMGLATASLIEHADQMELSESLRKQIDGTLSRFTARDIVLTSKEASESMPLGLAQMDENTFMGRVNVFFKYEARNRWKAFKKTGVFGEKALDELEGRLAGKALSLLRQMLLGKRSLEFSVSLGELLIWLAGVNYRLKLELAPFIIMNAWRETGRGSEMPFVDINAESSERTIIYGFISSLSPEELEKLRQKDIPGLMQVIDTVRNSPTNFSKEDIDGRINPAHAAIREGLVKICLHLMRGGDENEQFFAVDLLGGLPGADIGEEGSDLLEGVLTRSGNEGLKERLLEMAVKTADYGKERDLKITLAVLRSFPGVSDGLQAKIRSNTARLLGAFIRREGVKREDIALLAEAMGRSPEELKRLIDFIGELEIVTGNLYTPEWFQDYEVLSKHRGMVEFIRELRETGGYDCTANHSKILPEMLKDRQNLLDAIRKIKGNFPDFKYQLLERHSLDSETQKTVIVLEFDPYKALARQLLWQRKKLFKDLFEAEKTQGALPDKATDALFDALRAEDPSLEGVTATAEEYKSFNRALGLVVKKVYDPSGSHYAYRDFYLTRDLLAALARRPGVIDGLLDVPEKVPKLFELLGVGGPLERVSGSIARDIFFADDPAGRAQVMVEAFTGNKEYWEQLFLFTKIRLGEKLENAGTSYPITEIESVPLAEIVKEHTAIKAKDPDKKTRLESIIQDRDVIARLEKGEIASVPFSSIAGEYKLRIYGDYLRRTIELSRGDESKKKADARNRASSGEQLELGSGMYLHGTSAERIETMLLNGNLPQESLGVVPEGDEARTDAYAFQVDFARLLQEDIEQQKSTENIITSSLAGEYGTRGIFGKAGQMWFVYRRERGSWEEGKDHSAARSTPGHAVILGGMPAAEISAIVLRDPDATLGGVEKAITENGFYIPVYDLKGNLLFRDSDYDRMREDLNLAVPVDVWGYSMKVGGRLGSNPGAQFMVSTHEGPARFYAKYARPEAQGHIWSEFLADNIYKLLGIPVPDTRIVRVEGTYAHASRMLMPDRDPEASMDQLKDGFLADALMANWDCPHNPIGNTLLSNGVRYRIDNGCALLFHATGKRKARKFFGPEEPVRELEMGVSTDSLGEGMMRTYKEWGLTNEDIVKQALALRTRLTDGKIDELVDSVRLSAEDRDNLKQTLKHRRDYILAWVEERIHPLPPTVAVPGKGVLWFIAGAIFGLMNLLGITITPARRDFVEDFIIPLLEEGGMLLGLYFGGPLVYLGIRGLFTLLHAFQDRAPPAGVKRTLLQRIAIPAIASIAASLPLLALAFGTPLGPAIFAAVAGAGIFAHILGNRYVTVFKSRLQKAVLGKEEPSAPLVVAEPGARPKDFARPEEVVAAEGWRPLDLAVSFVEEMINHPERVPEEFKGKRSDYYLSLTDQEAYRREAERTFGERGAMPVRPLHSYIHEGTPWLGRQQVIELISNAQDAMSPLGKAIGRFGVGVYQVFNELKGGKDSIIVTTSEDGKTGMRLTFRLINGRLCFKPESITSESEKAEGRTLEKGTSIKVRRKLTKKEIDEKVGWIGQRLRANTRGAIKVNGIQVNRPEKYSYVNGDKLYFPEGVGSVEFTIDETGYVVKDTGTGMSPETLYEKFLVPKSGTKRIEGKPIERAHEIGEETRVFYSKILTEKEGRGTVTVQVTGVAIFQIEIFGSNIPEEMIIELPHDIWLPETRNIIGQDVMTKMGLLAIIDKLTDMERKDIVEDRYSLLNGLVLLVERLVQESKDESLLRELRKACKRVIKHEKDKGSKGRIILPNRKEFRALRLPEGREAIFLNESLYDFFPGDIEGVEGVANFRSPDTGHTLYIADLDTFTDEEGVIHEKDIFLEGMFRVGSGGWIILDRKIWEQHKNDPWLINLLFNFTIAYGDKGRQLGTITKARKPAPVEAKVEVPEVKEVKRERPPEEIMITKRGVEREDVISAALAIVTGDVKKALDTFGEEDRAFIVRKITEAVATGVITGRDIPKAREQVRGWLDSLTELKGLMPEWATVDRWVMDKIFEQSFFVYKGSKNIDHKHLRGKLYIWEFDPELVTWGVYEIDGYGERTLIGEGPRPVFCGDDLYLLYKGDEPGKGTVQIRREGRNETILEDVFLDMLSFREEEGELVFFTKKGKGVAVNAVRGRDVQDLFTVALEPGQDLVGVQPIIQDKIKMVGVSEHLLGSVTFGGSMEIVRRGEQIFVLKKKPLDKACEEIYRIDPTGKVVKVYLKEFFKTAGGMVGWDEGLVVTDIAVLPNGNFALNVKFRETEFGGFKPRMVKRTVDYKDFLLFSPEGELIKEDTTLREEKAERPEAPDVWEHNGYMYYQNSLGELVRVSPEGESETVTETLAKAESEVPSASLLTEIDAALRKVIGARDSYFDGLAEYIEIGERMTDEDLNMAIGGDVLTDSIQKLRKLQDDIPFNFYRSAIHDAILDDIIMDSERAFKAAQRFDESVLDKMAHRAITLRKARGVLWNAVSTFSGAEQGAVLFLLWLTESIENYTHLSDDFGVDESINEDELFRDLERGHPIRFSTPGWEALGLTHEMIERSGMLIDSVWDQIPDEKRHLRIGRLKEVLEEKVSALGVKKIRDLQFAGDKVYVTVGDEGEMKLMKVSLADKSAEDMGRLELEAGPVRAGEDLYYRLVSEGRTRFGYSLDAELRQRLAIGDTTYLFDKTGSYVEQVILKDGSIYSFYAPTEENRIEKFGIIYGPLKKEESPGGQGMEFFLTGRKIDKIAFHFSDGTTRTQRPAPLAMQSVEIVMGNLSYLQEALLKLSEHAAKPRLLKIGREGSEEVFDAAKVTRMYSDGESVFLLEKTENIGGRRNYHRIRFIKLTKEGERQVIYELEGLNLTSLVYEELEPGKFLFKRIYGIETLEEAFGRPDEILYEHIMFDVRTGEVTQLVRKGTHYFPKFLVGPTDFEVQDGGVTARPSLAIMLKRQKILNENIAMYKRDYQSWVETELLPYLDETDKGEMSKMMETMRMYEKWMPAFIFLEPEVIMDSRIQGLRDVFDRVIIEARNIREIRDSFKFINSVFSQIVDRETAIRMIERWARVSFKNRELADVIAQKMQKSIGGEMPLKFFNDPKKLAEHEHALGQDTLLYLDFLTKDMLTPPVIKREGFEGVRDEADIHGRDLSELIKLRSDDPREISMVEPRDLKWETVQKRIQEKKRRDLPMARNEIAGAVNSQDRTHLYFIRELAQNARDVIRGKMGIDVRSGFLGHGFYTVFAGGRSGDQVKILTGNGEETYELLLAPIYDSRNGNLVHIEVLNISRYEGDFKGTRIERISFFDSQADEEAMIGILYATSQARRFLGGVPSTGEGGVSITLNGGVINEDGQELDDTRTVKIRTGMSSEPIKAGQYGWITSVEDPVGMDLHTVLNKLLPPDISGKERQKVEDIEEKIDSSFSKENILRVNVDGLYVDEIDSKYTSLVPDAVLDFLISKGWNIEFPPGTPVPRTRISIIEAEKYAPWIAVSALKALVKLFLKGEAPEFFAGRLPKDYIYSRSSSIDVPGDVMLDALRISGMAPRGEGGPEKVDFEKYKYTANTQALIQLLTLIGVEHEGEIITLAQKKQETLERMREGREIGILPGGLGDQRARAESRARAEKRAREVNVTRIIGKGDREELVIREFKRFFGELSKLSGLETASDFRCVFNADWMAQGGSGLVTWNLADYGAYLLPFINFLIDGDKGGNFSDFIQSYVHESAHNVEDVTQPVRRFRWTHQSDQDIEGNFGWIMKKVFTRMAKNLDSAEILRENMLKALEKDGLTTDDLSASFNRVADRVAKERSPPTVGTAVTGWLERRTEGMSRTLRALGVAPPVEEAIYRGLPLVFGGLIALGTMPFIGVWGLGLGLLGTIIAQVFSNISFAKAHPRMERAPPFDAVRVLNTTTLISRVAVAIAFFSNPALLLAPTAVISILGILLVTDIISHFFANAIALVLEGIFPDMRVRLATISERARLRVAAYERLRERIELARSDPSVEQDAIEDARGEIKDLDREEARLEGATEASIIVWALARDLRRTLDKGYVPCDVKPNNNLINREKLKQMVKFIKGMKRGEEVDLDALEMRLFDLDKVYDLASVPWGEVSYFFFTTILQTINVFFRGQPEIINEYLDALVAEGIGEQILGTRELVVDEETGIIMEERLSDERREILSFIEISGRRYQAYSTADRHIKGAFRERFEGTIEVLSESFREELGRTDDPRELIINITESKTLSEKLDERTLEWFRFSGFIDWAFSDIVKNKEELRALQANPYSADLENFLLVRLTQASLFGIENIKEAKARKEAKLRREAAPRAPPLVEDKGLMMLLSVGAGASSVGGMSIFYNETTFDKDVARLRELLEGGNRDNRMESLREFLEWKQTPESKGGGLPEGLTFQPQLFSELIRALNNYENSDLEPLVNFVDRYFHGEGKAVSEIQKLTLSESHPDLRLGFKIFKKGAREGVKLYRVKETPDFSDSDAEKLAGKIFRRSPSGEVEPIEDVEELKAYLVTLSRAHAGDLLKPRTSSVKNVYDKTAPLYMPDGGVIEVNVGSLSLLEQGKIGAFSAILERVEVDRRMFEFVRDEADDMEGVILWSEGVLATDPVDGSSVWILKQRMFSENEKEANELLEEAVDNFSPRDVVDDKPLDQVDLDDIQNRFRAIREERAAQQERLREAEEVLRVARLEGAISQARDQGRVISTTESGAEIFDAQSIIQGDEETLGIIHTILPGVIDSAFGGLIEKVEEITEQDLRENRVFLAVIGGRIVGAIGYAIYDDLQMGSIKMVAVVKVLQNTGIGSALLDQAMRAFLKARDNGRINELRFASLDDAVYMTYFGNRGYRPKIEEGVLTLALAPEPAAAVERRIPIGGPEEVEAPEVTAGGLEKAGEVINRCFKAELPGSADPGALIDNVTKSQILTDELDEVTLEWIRSKGAIAIIFTDLLGRGEKRFEFLKKIGAENIDMEKFLMTRLKIIWLGRGEPGRAPPYSSHEKVRRELRTMYPQDIFGQHDMESKEDYFEAAAAAVVTNKEKVVQGEGPYGNKYHVATRPDASGQEVEVSFGESGFAVVYLGYEEDENDPVAIKTVYDVEEKVVLFREAAMLERLKEDGMEGIVEMRDMGIFVPVDEDGNPEEDAEGNEVTSYYMATTWAGDSMEYILQGRAEQGKALSAYEAKQFTIGVLKLLAQLHDKEILHLDIKPANIYVRPIGTTAEGEPIYDFSNPILGDFGTALEVRDTANLRRMHERYGTYLYMSQESTSFEYYSARSDLYALGWTLYETLMGSFPDNDDPYYYLHNPPEISPGAEREIPVSFLAFIRRLVDPEWSDRLASAEEALKIAEAIPVVLPPAPPLHFEALALKDEKGERKDVDPVKEKTDRKNTRKPIPGVDIRNVRGEDVFDMAPDELEALRKALDLKTDKEVGALIREAFSALDAWDIDTRRIKDKKILIALLKKNASKHLFEDHREDDFIGINEEFLDIGDPKIRRILFIVGLAHELRHEAGIVGERLDLDAMLTADLLIREDVGVDEFRMVLSGYIESTEYIDEVEKMPIIFLKGVYAQAESLFPVMRELMKRGARTRIIGPAAQEDMAEAESDVRNVKRAMGRDGDNLDVKYYAFEVAKHEKGYNALTKENGPLHNMLMRHNDDVAVMEKNPLLKPRMFIRLPRVKGVKDVRGETYRESLKKFIRNKLEEINTDKRTGIVDRNTMDKSFKRIEIIDVDAASATVINPVVDVIIDAGMMEVDRYENKEAREYDAEAPRRLKENLAMLLNSSLEGIMTTDEKMWDKKITADNLYNVMTQMFAGKLFWVIRAIDWASERQKFDAKQAVLKSL